MSLIELTNIQSEAVKESSIVKRGFAILEKLGANVVEKNPALWVPRQDFDLYNIEGKIENNPLVNDKGEVASRSCLLSFLSAVRQGRVQEAGIYTSIGAYYRHEEVVTPGVRESVFPQLEVEVMDSNAERALDTTLSLLRSVLRDFDVEYVVKIQGTLSRTVLARPEVVYAGVDRQWKLYKTKKNIGFEVYPLGEADAIAGGGDFTELARRFGLNSNLNAVGFGLGLLRIK